MKPPPPGRAEDQAALGSRGEDAVHLLPGHPGTPEAPESSWSPQETEPLGSGRLRGPERSRAQPLPTLPSLLLPAAAQKARPCLVLQRLLLPREPST